MFFTVEVVSRLRTDLSNVADEGFINYVTRQVDLGVQKATLQLAFQDYLKDFMFDASGMLTKRGKKLMEEQQEESEGFRKAVVTAWLELKRA